jgi:MerR-like DNA binding protein
LSDSTQEIGIQEAAKLLNRMPATLRMWDTTEVLPRELRPHRNARGWRYWTHDQIEGIKAWIVATDRRPGKALRGARPSQERVELHVERMRRPKASNAA